MNAGNSSSPYFTLTLPNEFLTYNVRVAAVNTQGQAQSRVLPICLRQNSQQGVQYMVPVCPAVLARMKLMVHHGQYLQEYSKECSAGIRSRLNFLYVISDGICCSLALLLIYFQYFQAHSPM